MIKKPARVPPVPAMHKTGIRAGLPWGAEEIFISPVLTARKAEILHRNAKPGEMQGRLFLRQFFQEVFVPPDFFPQDIIALLVPVRSVQDNALLFNERKMDDIRTEKAVACY